MAAPLPWGPDVSSWQGEIDLAAVKAAGASFVMLKASEGTRYDNPYFEGQWPASKEAALYRGAYHYARPDLGDPEAQADWLLTVVDQAGGLKTGDLLALDIEQGDGDLGGWVLAFVDRVRERVGFRPLIYTSAGFTDEHGLSNTPELGEYGLWLASWRRSKPVPPAPWDLLAFWQYTNAGRCDGINGLVDLNRFNGPAERIPLYGMQEGGQDAGGGND